MSRIGGGQAEIPLGIGRALMAENMVVEVTAEGAALIRAALSAYMAGIRETQKSILGADLEFAEVRTALRSLHTRFFQVNRPEGRRF